MHGEAVQVKPMTTKLKAPGIKRLELKDDNLHLSFASNFNLCRYSSALQDSLVHLSGRG